MSKKKAQSRIHKDKIPASSRKETTLLSTALFIAAGILIFYPPYFKGLFMPREMFFTHIITALVFAGLWIKKILNQDYTFIKTPLDVAVLAYTAVSLLSLLGAVDNGEALYGFLKVLNYFMIYWIITEIVKSYSDYENILNILLASAMGVALLGILAAWGYFNYPDAFNGKAISSTLQYSNAAGLYLGVMSLIAINQWISSQKIKWEFLYAGITYVLLLVSLATFSKGAWLIIIIGAVLTLIIMPGHYRVKAAYGIALSVAAVLIAASGFIPAILSGDISTAILFFLIGLLLSLLGQISYEVLIKVSKVHVNRKYMSLAAGFLILVILIGSTGIMINKHNEIVNRIADEFSGLSDFSSNSYSSRLDFARWGMSIVKDYPIIGAGAEGWSALYHQYKDRIAWSAETHNGFLQIWIETGTLGIIAFMSIWVLFLFSLNRIYRTNKTREIDNQDKLIKIWGTAIAAVCMGLHSFIDFDLSLPALSILLWTFFALINSAGYIENVNEKNLVPNIPIINISVAALIAILLLACGSSFALADNYARKGQTALGRLQAAESSSVQHQELGAAESCYKKAVQFDSYNGLYHAEMARIYAVIYTQLKEDNPQLADQYKNMVYTEMEKVDKLAPFDLKARGLLLSSSVTLGDIKEGVKQAQAAVTANPWDVKAYNITVSNLGVAADYCWQQGDYATAGNYAEQILNLQDKLQEKVRQLDKASSDKNQLELTYQSRLNIGKAHYILGDYEEAASSLEPMTGNMLAMELIDPNFENTEFENDDWKVEVVRDAEASNGKCLEVTAKRDMYGWPRVLVLGSRLPITAGEKYIIEVRFKVIDCGNSPGGEQGAKLGIWGNAYAGEQSKNTSFTFYKGDKDIKDISAWQVEQQILVHDEGYEERSFSLGTGSVARETSFRIDYVQFFPSDINNLPDNMRKASIWYAASLSQLGEKEEATKIEEQFAEDNALMELYVKLIDNKQHQ